MTKSKETIDEEKKGEKRFELCASKSPKALGKRKIASGTPAEVKQIKVVENTVPEAKTCAHCNKKLKFINTYICRCEKSFCTMHRFFDQHNCEFDFKTDAKNKLRNNNPKIVAEKIKE
ncbi:hypothetical protein ENBRE01_0451 [Enteropsectra breve]|nr:hypothetical protein ENBRE01_0451 [Enteropsectra breve]